LYETSFETKTSTNSMDIHNYTFMPLMLNTVNLSTVVICARIMYCGLLIIHVLCTTGEGHIDVTFPLIASLRKRSRDEKLAGNFMCTVSHKKGASNFS